MTSGDFSHDHDAPWLRQFRRRLLAWYRENKRDLPWRHTSDPYAVWVSEIMLQQTQVATVLGYYERFLARFPTVASLAEAEEAEVLRYWEGLGYYRRARQMHRAAQMVVQQHGGEFPTTFEEVLVLPGIGRYTAGAILSFACDQKLPIVEANTQRLYCRLLGHREDPTTAASLVRLWQFAESVLPRRHPGELNQALIELGATVCLPRQPRCEQCPALALCPTFKLKLQDQIPAAKRKMVYEDRHEAAVVVSKGAKVLLRKCAEGERWAGLWDFPRFVVGCNEFQADPQQHLSARLNEKFRIDVAVGERFTTMRHGVTKYRITLDCFSARWRSGALPKGTAGQFAWSAIDRLSDYPLSVTGRKISLLL